MGFLSRGSNQHILEMDQQNYNNSERDSWIGSGRPQRVLLLMGHTGGGHLRAAESVAEILRRRFGNTIQVFMVDALGEYAPFPLSQLARFYPWWIERATFSWRWGYRFSNNCRLAAALLRRFWPLVWPGARRLLQCYKADVIVSVHPLTNHVIGWALDRFQWSVPLLTVVTDPVCVHPFWLTLNVERCLVGSREAARKAHACGLSPDQVRVTGYPVNPNFIDKLTGRDQARRHLGWNPDRPAVLVVGGGDGVGPLYEIVSAIEAHCPHIQVGIITGRNRQLKARLQQRTWAGAVYVYGFVDHVREMPSLMSAADVLVTKAGPGTLHEAFLAGLPLILSGAIPGQEEGNVRHVVHGGAGVWAPDPCRIATLVNQWTGPFDGTLSRMARCSRALAQPDAATAVAEEIKRSLGRGEGCFDKRVDKAWSVH